MKRKKDGRPPMRAYYEDLVRDFTWLWKEYGLEVARESFLFPITERSKMEPVVESGLRRHEGFVLARPLWKIKE